MDTSKTPIVLTAFGTTTKAMDTYNYMDKIIRERFFNHKIEWAYSSRMVRDFSKKREKIYLKSPQQVLSDLVADGYPWSIVQSIHLICGNEFNRLVEEIQHVPIRTSVGLPLLHSPEDYDRVAAGMVDLLPELKEECVIIVGHGTDHPMWAAYIAFEHKLQEWYGRDIHVGMIENEDSCERIVHAVKESGKRKALLIPFMLVAGVHFKEDLVGNGEDSWKNRIEREGIEVRAIDKGFGFYRPIVEIFIDHIEDALDAIPMGIFKGI
jgi:sirohydrochlorin cobaltochelatase